MQALVSISKAKLCNDANLHGFAVGVDYQYARHVLHGKACDSMDRGRPMVSNVCDLCTCVSSVPGIPSKHCSGILISAVVWSSRILPCSLDCKWLFACEFKFMPWDTCDSVFLFRTHIVITLVWQCRQTHRRPFQLKP